jgi:protein transport protein SEC61 subunit gamma-like protein
MSDINAVIIEPLQKFARDSAYLVKKCTKPDRHGKKVNQCWNAFSCSDESLPLYFTIEFAKIARATGIGFLIMGFIGFFVKIVHIPINNIIVGGM